MIILGEDGQLYDIGGDFRNNFRNFTVYDEGAGGGQTIEIVGQRDLTPDLAAEYARQLQLQQERYRIIGYTDRGEPIYEYTFGEDPSAAGGEQTMGTVVTTGTPTEDTDTTTGGVPTGSSGLLGNTPTGTTGATGNEVGGGVVGGGTTGGTSGTTTGTGGGTGGTGGGQGGTGTGDGGGGLDGGLLGGTGVTNTNIPTVFNPEPVEIIDSTDVFTPDIPVIYTPDIVTPVPPVTPPVPPVIPPVPPVVPPVPPVTPPVPPVTPPVTPPPPPSPPEMIAYGGGNFFSVPIQQGFYSERGFEPGFMPFGQGYPTFRSGVAGYTPMVPTGFEFGIPQVFAPRVVFQPGVFDPGIIGEDGTWRPTPKPTDGTTPGTGGGTKPGFNEPE